MRETMKAKAITNIEPWDESECPELEVGREYEVRQVTIGGWSTEVELENGRSYDSTMFDDEFQEKLDKALDWFGRNPGYDTYGCFVKDFY